MILISHRVATAASIPQRNIALWSGRTVCVVAGMYVLRGMFKLPCDFVARALVIAGTSSLSVLIPHVHSKGEN